MSLAVWKRGLRDQLLHSDDAADTLRRLLRLADLLAHDKMVGESVLCRPRQVLADKAAVSPATVQRLLAQSVAAGWLQHRQVGCRGRMAEYIAAVPERKSLLIRKERSKQVTSDPQSAPNASHPCVNSDTANASHLVIRPKDLTGERRDRLALDENRERHDDHDDSRDHQAAGLTYTDNPAENEGLDLEQIPLEVELMLTAPTRPFDARLSLEQIAAQVTRLRHERGAA